MEKILLIETSTALCSVALAEDGLVTAYRESSAPKAHASLTAVFVQEVLEERGLKLADCDAAELQALLEIIQSTKRVIRKARKTPNL